MKKFLKLALGAAALVLGVALPNLQADTTTDRFGLTLPSIGSYGWPQKTNANWSILDSTAASQYRNNVFTATNTFNSSTYMVGKLDASGTFIVSTITFRDGTTQTTAGGPGGGGTDPTKLPLDGSEPMTGPLTVGSSVTATGDIETGGVFRGSGGAITNLSAGQLTGTVPNASVDSSSVTKQGNTFNSAGKLVLLDGSGRLPAVDGSQLTNLAGGGDITGVTASAPLTGGGDTGSVTVGVDGSSVTLQGNTFNSANKLVQLNGAGALPALSGANLTSLPAANLTGTVPNASLDGSSITKQGNTFNGASQLLQLSGSALVPNANVDGSSVTKQGNTFNGANQLVQLNGTGALPALSAANLTSVPAANLSGTVPNASVDTSSVTKQGNTFNGANQLVKLNGTGQLPALDGSLLTGITGGTGASTSTVNNWSQHQFFNGGLDASSATITGNAQVNGTLAVGNYLVGGASGNLGISIASGAAQGEVAVYGATASTTPYQSALVFRNTGNIVWADNGVVTPSMYLASGKLGLGVPSPIRQIEASGDIYGSSVTANHNMSVGIAPQASYKMYVYGLGTAGNTAFLSGDATSSGYLTLGFGRTSTEARLAIAAANNNFVSGSVPGDIIFVSTSVNGKIHMGAQVAATPAITISSAAVGMGTTSPTAKLQIVDTAGTNNKVFAVSTGTVDVFSVYGASVNLKVPLYFPDGTAQTTAGGAGSTPGGSAGYVQYRNASAQFAGDSTLVFNDSTKVLSASTMTATWGSFTGLSAGTYYGSGSGLWNLYDPTVGRSSWTATVGGSTTIFKNDGIQWLGSAYVQLGGSGNASAFGIGTSSVAFFGNNYGFWGSSITTPAGNFVLNSSSFSYAGKYVVQVPRRVKIWIPAGSWAPAVTNGGQSVQSLETATNKVNFDVIGLSSSTTNYVYCQQTFPKSWDASTVTFSVVWTSTSGTLTNGVAFGLQGLARSDDDAIDTAYGTAVKVTDALIATNDLHRTAASTSVTIGGSPAKTDTVFLRLYRDVDDAADTLDYQADLIGVEMTITLNDVSDD